MGHGELENRFFFLTNPRQVSWDNPGFQPFSSQISRISLEDKANITKVVICCYSSRKKFELEVIRNLISLVQRKGRA